MNSVMKNKVFIVGILRLAEDLLQEIDVGVEA